MERETREQYEAAEIMWLKRGIDEVESGVRDPFEFGNELGSRKWSRELLEKATLLVEDACLQKIGLLEDYELNLRGDCVSKDRVHSVETHYVYGTYRNERVKLDTDDKKQAALVLVAGTVIKVYTTARLYERRSKEKKEGNPEVPVIMYGFNTFNQNQDFSPLQRSNKYFRGETDDIGNSVSEMFFLEIPTLGTRGNASQSISGDDDFFPLPSLLNPDETQALLNSKSLNERRNKVFSTIETSGWDICLYNPESYLKSLILADTLLLEVEEYDRRLRGEIDDSEV